MDWWFRWFVGGIEESFNNQLEFFSWSALWIQFLNGSAEIFNNQLERLGRRALQIVHRCLRWGGGGVVLIWGVVMGFWYQLAVCRYCEIKVVIIYINFYSSNQERPYHNDSTASRLLSEVKHCRARLVLRWGTTLESLVLFFCILLLSFLHQSTYTMCLLFCVGPC